MAEIKLKGILSFFRARYYFLYQFYYDWTRGVATIGDITVEELDIADAERKTHAKQYSSINAKDLKNIFSHISPKPESVLLDYGCGKGRVLFVAAEAGIQNLRGVEISSRLSSIAVQNVNAFSRMGWSRLFWAPTEHMNFEIANGDAAKYELKGDETIFCFFNPFDAVVMEQVLDNIIYSLIEHPRKNTLIYVKPAHQELIIKKGFVKEKDVVLKGRAHCTINTWRGCEEN